MIYNYHTHTIRCGHARDDAEDYIKQAISCGIKHMGFSDHMPFMFPDGYESSHRVPVAEAEDYFRELCLLRDKYKDEIEIKIGFEMEYYPKYFDSMLKNSISYGAEYLILGQHFIGNEHPGGFYVNYATDDERHLEEYADEVAEAVSKGVFTYIAHPDIIKFTGNSYAYEGAVRKICAASKERDVPLEINFLGIRCGRNYPNMAFWKIAGEEKAPVTFGLDSHSAAHAYDGESLKIAKNMVQEFDLNYIGEPRLRDIKLEAVYP